MNNPVNVGILHPGAMGVSVAASIKASGARVHWVSAGRSQLSCERAKSQELQTHESLASLCAACTYVVSVCPPHAAEDQAQAVMQAGFQGVYLDANAISPQRAQRIASLCADAGVDMVDGGIIGGPAWQPDSTILALSGALAVGCAELCGKGNLVTQVVGEEIGKASALKMCFAAWTKGQTAMLSAVVGAAESLGVRSELEAIWDRGNNEQSSAHHKRLSNVTAKAWRFAGEMEEIAETFSAAGMPGGFHEAAAAIYQRMAGFKDDAERPGIDAVLSALLKNTDEK